MGVLIGIRAAQAVYERETGFKLRELVLPVVEYDWLAAEISGSLRGDLADLCAPGSRLVIDGTLTVRRGES